MIFPQDDVVDGFIKDLLDYFRVWQLSVADVFRCEQLISPSLLEASSPENGRDLNISINGGCTIVMGVYTQ